MLSLATAAVAVGVMFEALQALTGLGGHGLNRFADVWTYTAVELIAVSICLARVLRRREDRAAWGWMTFALVAWTAGDLTWTLWLDHVPNPPYPSVADGLYLAMYPAIYVCMMLLIRSRLRHAGVAQWLDGGVVGLAIAATAGAIVFPVVGGSTSDHFVPAAVNVAYPVGDLALLLFVAVAYSLSGWRPGRAWLLLGAGVVLNAIADIALVYQVSKGTYVQGTVLDAAWPASMALMALSAWQPVRRQVDESVDAPHTIVLTLGAATGALTLLVVAAFRNVTPVAVGLAAGALVLATLRAGLTYLENVRMLRRNAQDALTDSLSGLRNRRRLMHDLEVAVSESQAGVTSTLAFFDLNGFKRYNDSFGHAAGDALLARLGGALERAVEGRGYAYRLGGDEFCALVAGRVGRHDVLIERAAGALVERGTAFTVIASLGVAVIPDDAPTASAALQIADQRMYAEKAGAADAGRVQASRVLMALLSERTPVLHEHVTVVGALAKAVGAELGLGPEALDELVRAAELHDVGKLAIPDEILDKPGPLDESEWKFIRQHPVIGERILSAAPALKPVGRLVRASHERWDGEGYPDRLDGPQIPLGARIVGACDAYEAMTADRCYQAARSQAEAVAELRRHAGTQFDPAVVDVLCRYVESQADPELARPGARHAELTAAAPARP